MIMKRLWSLLLAIILVLSGCGWATTSQPTPGADADSSGGSNDLPYAVPSLQIHIRGKAAIATLREKILLDEAEFGEFLKSLPPDPDIRATHGENSQQDFVDLLRLVDTEVVPVIPGVKDYNLVYHVDKGLSIVYKMEGSERYTFDISLVPDKGNVENMIENLTKSRPELLYESKNGQVKVYANTVYSSKNARWFCLDADGGFVQSSYYNDNIEDISKLKAEDIYKNLYFGFLKDIQ